MDCSFIKDNLFALAEGTLKPDEQLAAELHLQGCQECAQLVNGFSSINDRIKNARSLEPDSFASTRIIEHLESHYLHASGNQSFLNRFLLRPALLGLFVGIAVITGILLGRYGSTNHDQISRAKDIEDLRSELYISVLTDENIMLISNP